MQHWTVGLLVLLIVHCMRDSMSEALDDWQCPDADDLESGAPFSADIYCFHDHIEIEWSADQMVFVKAIQYSCFGPENAQIENGTGPVADDSGMDLKDTYVSPPKMYTQVIALPPGAIYCIVEGCYDWQFVVYRLPVRNCSIPQTTSSTLSTVPSSSQSLATTPSHYLVPTSSVLHIPVTSTYSRPSYETSTVYSVTPTAQPKPENAPGVSKSESIGLILSIVAVTGVATLLTGITIAAACVVMKRLKRRRSSSELSDLFGYSDVVDPDYQPVEIEGSSSITLSLYSVFDELNHPHIPAAANIPGPNQKGLPNASILQEEEGVSGEPETSFNASVQVTSEINQAVVLPWTEEGLHGEASPDVVDSADYGLSSLFSTSVPKSDTMSYSDMDHSPVSGYVHPEIFETTGLSSENNLQNWSLIGDESQRDCHESTSIPELDKIQLSPIFSSLIVGGYVTESSGDSDSHRDSLVESCLDFYCSEAELPTDPASMPESYTVTALHSLDSDQAKRELAEIDQKLQLFGPEDSGVDLGPTRDCSALSMDIYM